MENKIDDYDIKNKIERERFSEVLQMFFIDQDKDTHYTNFTYLLWTYSVLEEEKCKELERVMKKLGDSIYRSVYNYDKEKYKDLTKKN